MVRKGCYFVKTLYFGGDIVTMEGEKDIAEAVLVTGGMIERVGRLKDFQGEMKDGTIKKIDLKGKTLLPGFIDPHSHLASMGTLSIIADLSECESFASIIETLKTYIQKNGLDKGEFVIGRGYDHNFLKEEKHPTKDVLNQVSREHPIFIMHASGHVGCANDLALKMANIDENTPDEAGGRIGRIAGTREPNGYLEEGSMSALRQQAFANLTMDMKQLIQVGQEVYIKNGITTAQDGATSSETFGYFKQLAKLDLLKIDIVVYPLVNINPDDLKNHPEYAKSYNHRLKIGGYKLFLDGSPQSKTAWLSEPYEGEEDYRGYPLYEDDEVKDYALRAIDDGVQLLTHCNGDAASDQLLVNYERALIVSDHPNKHHLRPVMIHCQTVREDQLDKMVELGMIPSIFNAHTYYWGDVHLRNLGPKRGRRISPARSAFDRGLVVNFHQDAPVVTPDMLHTIWCAVNRITRRGVQIGPEECVSVYEALKAVTINAAYAYFEEDQKGSIKPGKLADFVILDKNPMTVDRRTIKDIQVLETIKEGKVIYRREDLGGVVG